MKRSQPDVAKDHHGSPGGQGEKSERFVATGWPPKEVDPASFAASVLIG